MRRILSIILITLACILTPLSLVVLWTKAEVTNTDTYVATVAPLASDPNVQAAVTTRLNNVINEKLDIQVYADELVAEVAEKRGLSSTQEDKLDGLATQLAMGIQAAINQKVGQVVASEQFAEVWTKANEVGHNQVQAFLSGDTKGNLTVANNEISVNLGPIVEKVKNELVSDGYRIAEKIPDTDATFVLVQSDQIGQAQKAYAAVDTLGWALPIATLIIGIIGVLIARKRSTAAMGLGLGLIAASLVTAVGMFIGRDVYLSHLPQDGNPLAAQVLFDTLLSRFKVGVVGVGVLGAIIAALAWLFRNRRGKIAPEPSSMDDLLNRPAATAPNPAPAPAQVAPAAPSHETAVMTHPAPAATTSPPIAAPSTSGGQMTDEQEIEELLRQTKNLE